MWGNEEEADTTPIEYNTEILRIDIEPNPVVAGDSISFTCIIKDSLGGCRFQWFILPGDTLWEETPKNVFKIKSTDKPGVYNGMVGVYNYEESWKGVPYGYFSYEVIKN